MDSEDSLLRPPPTRPYRPGMEILVIPVNAVIATLQLLQRAGRRESGLFWYGTRDALGHSRVAYVVAPRQTMTWGNYHISAQALAQVVNDLPAEWRPLAQVHSHPGAHIEHSLYDDRMASSRKALSIVFPHYGRSHDPFPRGVGVHEWQLDYWHLLDQTAAERRVRLAPGDVKVEDLR